MQANQFLLLGAPRTYWMFLRGMGLAVTIFLTIEAVVFWQLGTLTKTHGRGVRPMLMAFVVAYLAMAVNSYEYFFLAPVITELLIAACLGMAFATVKETEATEAGRAVGALG
jgi:dolichyl-phosphate-mannose--protein O-mannosyl transferase